MKFTDMQAWQKGMELVKEVYALTKNFPKEEMYGLKKQLRKAVTSILANFAEGFSRLTDDDKAHKYTISRGECAETHALLLISIELGFIKEATTKRAIELVLEVGKIFSGLIQTYRKSSSPNPSPSPSL